MKHGWFGWWVWTWTGGKLIVARKYELRHINYEMVLGSFIIRSLLEHMTV